LRLSLLVLTIVLILVLMPLLYACNSQEGTTRLPTPTQTPVVTSTPSMSPTNTHTPIADKTMTPQPTLVSLQKPGSGNYFQHTIFENPLVITIANPGPCGYQSVVDCIDYCSHNECVECRDWLQSIYLSLDTSNQVDITGSINGIWLPTIDAVRDAVRLIPSLKEDGINTVSFGPDIVTRDVDIPRTVGDNLFRFYIKIFEDAGFNVHLVPNSMHWGNNDVHLSELNDILVNWADEAEKLDIMYYAAFNEVDGMNDTIRDTSTWLQEVLPLIREKYSGIVCVQPTQAGFTSGKLDYSGYDCVCSFFPLMVPDQVRNDSAIEDFTRGAEMVKDEYPSVQYVLFTDVHTFYGGNWAETTIMEFEIAARRSRETIYVTEEEQAEVFETFFAEVYPSIDGCFLNNWTGFRFTGRSAEQVIREHYTDEIELIPQRATDNIWATPGLLELIESVTMDDVERRLIFDLDSYVPCWAGLCHEPQPQNPGPFGCTSIDECMQLFRKNPEEYWTRRIEKCD